MIYNTTVPNVFPPIISYIFNWIRERDVACLDRIYYNDVKKIWYTNIILDLKNLGGLELDYYRCNFSSLQNRGEEEGMLIVI